jgi:hypothetical protein
MTDWINALNCFSENALSMACDTYLRNQPRRRPTPGDIRALAGNTNQTVGNQRGDRNRLSRDELIILEGVLETARRWLNIPSLRAHGEKSLAFWDSK